MAPDCEVSYNPWCDIRDYSAKNDLEGEEDTYTGIEIGNDSSALPQNEHDLQ